MFFPLCSCHCHDGMGTFLAVMIPGGPRFSKYTIGKSNDLIADLALFCIYTIILVSCSEHYYYIVHNEREKNALR